MKYKIGDILTNGEEDLRVVHFDPIAGKYDLVNVQQRKNKWRWFSQQELGSRGYHLTSKLSSKEERRRKRQEYHREYYLRRVKPKREALRFKK